MCFTAWWCIIVGFSTYLLTIQTTYERSGRVWVKLLRLPMMRLYSIEFTKLPSTSFLSCNFASMGYLVELHFVNLNCCDNFLEQTDCFNTMQSFLWFTSISSVTRYQSSQIRSSFVSWTFWYLQHLYQWRIGHQRTRLMFFTEKIGGNRWRRKKIEGKCWKKKITKKKT